MNKNYGLRIGALALAFALCAASTAWAQKSAPKAAPAAPRDILVVQVGPFTGPQGPSGKGIRAGIKLYFDSVNASGGVKGAKIRFETKDDGYRPADTVKLMKETLASERPAAFIAAVGTANIELLMKENVLTSANVPVVGAVSGASSMIGMPNIFVTKATHHDEVDKLFGIITAVGINRVAVVYQNDPFGIDVLTGAEKAAVKTGVKILAKAPYPRNTTDVSAAVGTVLEFDPPLIYLGAITTAAIEFIKQYRQKGGRAQIYGLSVIDGSVLIDKLGADLSAGFAYGTVVPPATAKEFAVVREYLQLASRAKDPEMSGRSMEGFIAAKVLVDALRRADNPTSSTSVIKALAATKELDLGDYIVDFTRPGRTGSLYVDFAILNTKGQIVR
jgi:branched-chain amino acid transport system substrate-binding protein